MDDKLEKMETRSVSVGVDRSIQEGLPENVVRVRLTKEVPDLHGTVFRVAGMDTSRAERERSVFLGHNTRLSKDNLPIGHSENITKRTTEDGVATIEADLVFDEDDELAMRVAKKVKKGIMGSVSIRAFINTDKIEKRDDGVHEIKESKLAGFDVVGMGSNPSAHVIQRDVMGDDLKEKLREAADLILRVLDVNVEDEDTIINEQEEQEDTSDEESEVSERNYLEELCWQIDQREQEKEQDHWINDLNLDDIDFS